MSNKIWIAIAFLLIFTGGGVVYMKTRGLRNNNPGNIRDTGTGWQGLADPRNDGAYLIFIDAKYGIRALAKILHNYQALHSLKTVREMIDRWAPPIENNTDAYVSAVANALHVDPNAEINVDAHMPAMVAAIIHHENGVQPYPDATINEGIALAGITA